MNSYDRAFTRPTTRKMKYAIWGLRPTSVLSDREPGSTGDYWPVTYVETGKRAWINLRHVISVVEEDTDA